MSEREQSQAAQAGSSRRRGAVPTYSWARTPPARLVRSGIQYGALVPLLKFISPFTVIGKRNLAITIPLGIAMAFVIWAVFSQVLMLNLPAGPLERLFVGDAP